MTVPILAIVIPCYNEEDCIDRTTKRLIEVLNELEKNNDISEKSFIFFVNDGSQDKSWELIEKYNKETNGKVKGIKFSRNFGNQKAILAGLLESYKYDADCFITLDADLQQDENKIKEFVDKYKKGTQIVCGIRNDRKTDGFFKKFTALTFYKFMNLLGVHIKINHSDYRLISREIVSVLQTFPETNLFLRGIFNELGFKKDYVYFDVKERFAGHTKFTPFSLFTLAINGITSFSIIPLRFVTVIGFLMSFISIIIGIHSYIMKLIGNCEAPGWPTLAVTIGIIGGVQILCIGIIGEYIGQLFQEVKARPRYIVEKELG
ncbi:glycosyltransferase family 2 protein [bacterium]|nr:glycosyltransferase family 2 protein [bacterium]